MIVKFMNAFHQIFTYRKDFEAVNDVISYRIQMSTLSTLKKGHQVAENIILNLIPDWVIC